MAETQSTTAKTFMYFALGFVVALAVTSMQQGEQSYQSDASFVEQALGPDVGDEDLGTDDTDELGETEQIYQPPPLGTVSSVRHALGQAGKLGGAKITPKRIYSTANVPGADVGQFRMSAGKFNRPAPATTATETAKIQPAPTAKAPTAKAPTAKAPTAKAPQMPQVSTRGGETIIPR
jgi:hypothetical protein